jgi:type I restriction enzyme R subunit
MPVLCDRRDIVVLTDEAHRSQYDTLALNMRAALPHATFLAFTGTPLIAGEERTREVFGDYVSIYDFQQSVEDHATVPLYYENRTPELKLDNPDLNDDLYALIEEAELDEAQEQKLERELGRQYHLITRDERLETIAKDIVQHFLGRGFQGKAMVISIDKATALKMHDKVRHHWELERQRVEAELDQQMRYGEKADPLRVSELIQRLEIIKTTDMALIVSSGQNEIAQMAALGLDIAPHRKRMNDEALDEKFKDPKDPLRIVFLCAMWLTGFDAPSCSTVYLDKPMRNHTLMQTIARANRVFLGKHSGMIVDYANVFASLERALAIYGAGQGGRTPVRDKVQLVQELLQAIENAVAFCAEHGVDIGKIDRAEGLAKLTAIGFAVNALIAPDPLRKEFLAHDRLVQTLYNAVKPAPVVLEFRARVTCIGTIADAIRVKINPGPADISGVLASVNALLDESISSEGFTIKKGRAGESAAIDLSGIDFKALAKRFKNSKIKNIDLERLKAAIRAKLGRLIRLNRTRTDFQEKFEQLIEAYNSGSRNIDDLFKELLELSQSLTDEEQRHVREHLTEEELTIFDLLTRPGPDLSPQEREEVKKVAKDLLGRFKAILSLDWRQRAQARAQVRLAIEDVLDAGLPRAYTPKLYQVKAGLIFEHLYESYPNMGMGVYAELGG